VSERTIYRYIDDLSLAGIPVYGEAGLGYRLSEGFEMAPLQLSAAELEALITGVNLVAVLTGKGMADPARALLAKIEAALPAKEARAPRVPVVRVLCREQMAHFKAPKRIIFTPLPKTSTGKVQKFMLRKQLA